MPSTFILDQIILPYETYSFLAFGENNVYYMYQLGFLDSPVSTDSIFVCILFLILVVIVLFVGVGRKNKVKQADVYLAGVSCDNKTRTYIGSMNKKTKATHKNMYLSTVFGEKNISTFCLALSIILLSLSLIAAMFGYAGII